MVRGVIAFLVIAMVFTAGEYRKEAIAQEEKGGAEEEHFPGDTKPSQGSRLPCMSTAAYLCGPPCTITVDFKHPGKTRKHAWLYPGQSVTWVNADSDEDLDKLHFRTTETSAAPKSGDKVLADATCVGSGCIKTVNDATTCIAYKYTVKGKKTGKIDPEVEVGTSTYPFDNQSRRTTTRHP